MPRAKKSAVSKGREIYDANLDTVMEVIEFTARRRLLTADEKEDFSSYVHIKLMRNDCAILGKFKGDSTLRTYLVTTVKHLFLDFRIEKWGKWRHSAAAKRLGPVAQKLETLCYRDGFTFSQACQILRTNHKIEMSDEELSALFVQIPERVSRRFEGEEKLESVQDSSKTGEDAVLKAERSEAQEGIEEILRNCLKELNTEDRLILRLRFEDGIKIVEIARVVGSEPKILYRRFERLYPPLKRCIESSGISSTKIKEVLRD